MEKSKRTILQTAICIGLLCVIWGGYYLLTHYGTDRILEITEDDFSWVYQVDSARMDNKEFVLRGFAFELDDDAIEGAFEIVLQDTESGKNYFPKMKYITREDVNAYFLCEHDYLQSGFEASISERKLDFDEKNYEVLLRVVDERVAYRTGTYISKGQLIYTEPEEFEPLDVDGTDLEDVVENGILRVYRPDYGMYVYQYQKELYWIAELEYKFDEKNDTYVQYHTNTTQVNRLPQYRLENNWFFDDLGFAYSKNELKEWNVGKYRVAKCGMPEEYSITRIWTGNYAEGIWDWRNDFRPLYEFK